MKNSSSLIIRYALLEGWTCVLAGTTRLNIKWEITHLKRGLERTITTPGKISFLRRLLTYFVIADKELLFFLCKSLFNLTS